jgi:hypothetical protein
MLKSNVFSTAQFAVDPGFLLKPPFPNLEFYELRAVARVAQQQRSGQIRAVARWRDYR